MLTVCIGLINYAYFNLSLETSKTHITVSTLLSSFPLDPRFSGMASDAIKSSTCSSVLSLCVELAQLEIAGLLVSNYKYIHFINAYKTRHPIIKFTCRKEIILISCMSETI